MLNNIYRAKSKKNNQWVYGNLINVMVRNEAEDCFEWKCAIQSYEKYNDIESMYVTTEISKETILKNTGHNDIKGNTIFEGDICIVKHGLDDYYYIVKWIFSGFQFRLSKKPDSNVWGISHGINCGYLEDYDGDILVVGNIVDNKELIYTGE